MNKKQYVSSELKVIAFRTQDIVVTSGGSPGDGEGLWKEPEGFENDIFGD